jgi:acetolactate synthase-1/2/3 large subunit
MIKLTDYVMNSVADRGVQHVFMLPGGGCMHLVDSVGKHPRLDYVCLRPRPTRSIRIASAWRS